jgi:hypothetical protein
MRRTSHRRSRTGGQLKAAAIVAAAHALVEAGVTRAADLDPGSALQRSAYCGVKGLGPVTWSYLLMLAGHPGVKADTWLNRYVAQAVGRATSPAKVEHLVTAAAATLGLDPTDLDHAIWALMSRTGD